MNSTQLNNERHNKALKQYDDFVKAGNKVTRPADDYKGLTYEFPKPKNRKGGRR